MKVTELRVCNCIEDWTDVKNGPIQRQIDLEDFCMIFNYGNHPLPFKPIPLTEEWLDKFSIDKEDITMMSIVGGNGFYFVIDNYYKQVYYLHEVQNLYWCLFGEELEVKL